MRKALQVAIIGTGNIGTDLLIKAMRSSHLECMLFAGRNLSSPGMQKALSLGVVRNADLERLLDSGSASEKK